MNLLPLRSVFIKSIKTSGREWNDIFFSGIRITREQRFLYKSDVKEMLLVSKLPKNM